MGYDVTVITSQYDATIYSNKLCSAPTPTNFARTPMLDYVDFSYGDHANTLR